MIETRTMYDLYHSYLNKKIELLEVEIDSLEILLVPIRKQLTKYKTEIEKQVPYHSVLAGDIKELPRTETVEHKVINIQLKNYHILSLPIKNKQRQIKSLQKQILPYTIYKRIIRKFNAKVTDAMIEKGYVFKVPHFGDLFVEVVTNKRKRINWGASKKVKKQIEARGEIPYSKEDAKAAEEAGEEYKGVMWYVYHPETDVWLKWDYRHVNHGSTPNITHYEYKPTRGSNTASFKLVAHKKTLNVIDFAKYVGYDS